MANKTIKLTGIVIREIRTKESDKIINVFCREQGVVSIYAKGAKRLKNKFNTATNLFTYSEFVVFERKNSDLYSLNEANVIHQFYGVSENIEFLALAMYMSELLREVSVTDDMNGEILRLFLNMLHVMTTKKWAVPLCKAAFEMRLLSDTGFRPNLVGCKRCGKYEAEMFFFDPLYGHIICPSCHKSYDSGLLTVEMPVLHAMRYLAYADLDKMFSFKLTKEYTEQLGIISEKYVKSHTEGEYKTLDFYNSLMRQGDFN